MSSTHANWPKTAPNNIIVRMPNWIGDFVMATPVLQDLRVHFPDATLTAMCQDAHAALLDQNPHINECVTFKPRSGWIHTCYRPDILQRLRQAHYDLGLLLTNTLSSAWWFWGGNVQNRIGYAKHGRSLLLNRSLQYPSDAAKMHQVDIYKNLLSLLNIPRSPTKPALYVSQERLEAARALLIQYGWNEKTTLIGVNPGAAYGSAKCWLPERFRELTQKLLDQTDASIVYFGDLNTEALVQEITHNMPSRVINLAGKSTLKELIALIACCKILVTNDSGPMHIAAAVGTFPLALFGSTNPTQTGPYGIGEVIYKRAACSPCYQRRCPIDFRCMKDISVEDVFSRLLYLLKIGVNHDANPAISHARNPFSGTSSKTDRTP